MDVLIVDDSPTALLHSHLCVEEAAATAGVQITVRTATDGESALLAVDQQPADLVVLDIQLPGISGLDVCAELKARADKPRVAFVTGSLDTRMLEQAKIAGADFFIGKPLSASSFVEILK